MGITRRILIAIVSLLLLSLAALHAYYPLQYVVRVFVYQQPDYDDIHRFPASVIDASRSPSILPVALDARIGTILERHPDIESFDAFLEATDTTAFLVVHEGRLIEERYLQGHDQDTVQNSFSVSKSVASALIGLATRDGFVSLAAPITDYLPELAERDPRFTVITLEHLLDMRSGIRFSSAIRFPIINADNPLIYYHPDLQSVLLEHTSIDSAPGTFQYNNYNPPLLGLMLQRTMGISVSTYLEQALWDPLGASRSAGWTIDDKGLERMESGFHATARDLARFGLLYLNGGLAGERRVLPESWVRRSTDTIEPIELEQYDGRRWGYRLGWWIVPRPEGPSDFTAIGRDGQFLYISPRYESVFVRNGPDRGDWGDRDWTGLFYFAAEQLGKPSHDSTGSGRSP